MKHVSAPAPATDATPPPPTPPAAWARGRRARGKERNFAQTFLFLCNVLATLLLLAALMLLYAYPEKLAALHVSEQMTQMVTLNLISLLLLVAWLQRNLTGAWRAFTLGAAFMVLAESWLVGLT